MVGKQIALMIRAMEKSFGDDISSRIHLGSFVKILCLILPILMSHWHNTMVDGAKFWISCQQLIILRKASHWQLIQNSAPSTIVWRQCDIRMIRIWVTVNNSTMFFHMVRHKNIKHSVKNRLTIIKVLVSTTKGATKNDRSKGKSTHGVHKEWNTGHQNFHILLVDNSHNFLFAYILLLHVNISVTGSFNIFGHIPCFFSLLAMVTRVVKFAMEGYRI